MFNKLTEGQAPSRFSSYLVSRGPLFKYHIGSNTVKYDVLLSSTITSFTMSRIASSLRHFEAHIEFYNFYIQYYSIDSIFVV